MLNNCKYAATWRWPGPGQKSALFHSEGGRGICIESFFMDRFYRSRFNTEGLYSFRLVMAESDLFFVCDENLESRAMDALKEARGQLEDYTSAHPAFRDSLTPVRVERSAPIIPRWMARAAALYGVGPMAAVAGAVARHVGNTLSPLCRHLIIENGGDIFLKSDRAITLGVYGGEDSPFAGKLSFTVESKGKPLSVCTSSGTVGHSLSFGKADAVVAIAARADVADAAATAIGNRVKAPGDVEMVLEQEKERGLLKGLIVVIGDRMGAWGDIKFI